MPDQPDRSGQKPAPPTCPVCGTEMTLTIEHRDGDEVKVWICPRYAEHAPPADWWQGIPPP